MLNGDVKSAFRQVPMASELADHFAGTYRRDLTVVDLCLPFGWTVWSSHLGAFGGGISFLVARESLRSFNPSDDDGEPFFSFVWVGDHTLVESNRGQRLHLTETALRLSLLAVLGPQAINDKKFSKWETRPNALGLIWDTQQRTVSLLTDKIEKALLIDHLKSSEPSPTC